MARTGGPKYGANKSRMKLLDVSEVQGLTNEAKEREKQLDTKAARKRKLLADAAAKGLVKKSKMGGNAKDSAGASNAGQDQAQQQDSAASANPPAANGAGGGGLVAAALMKYKQKVGEPAAPSDPASDPVGSAVDNNNNNDSSVDNSWMEHLEKSNKLSAANRERVRQFFVDRYNPTPDQSTFRMKLHEEKAADPTTGGVVKETLYLELDYNTFGFKKLRKRKQKDA